MIFRAPKGCANALQAKMQKVGAKKERIFCKVFLLGVLPVELCYRVSLSAARGTAGEL
jgi:hypothetical protein